MSRWAWRGMTIRLAHQGMTIRLLPQPQHKNAKAAGPAMLGAAAGVQSAQLRERCGPHRWSGSGNRKGGAESTPCLAHQFKKTLSTALEFPSPNARKPDLPEPNLSFAATTVFASECPRPSLMSDRRRRRERGLRPWRQHRPATTTRFRACSPTRSFRGAGCH